MKPSVALEIKNNNRICKLKNILNLEKGKKAYYVHFPSLIKESSLYHSLAPN